MKFECCECDLKCMLITSRSVVIPNFCPCDGSETICKWAGEKE